jgi:hypothetical protein
MKQKIINQENQTGKKQIRNHKKLNQVWFQFKTLKLTEMNSIELLKINIKDIACNMFTNNAYKTCLIFLKVCCL